MGNVQKVVPRNQTYRAVQFTDIEEFEDISDWVKEKSGETLHLGFDGQVYWSEVGLRVNIGDWLVLTNNGILLFTDKRFNQLYKKKENND